MCILTHLAGYRPISSVVCKLSCSDWRSLCQWWMWPKRARYMFVFESLGLTKARSSEDPELLVTWLLLPSVVNDPVTAKLHSSLCSVLILWASCVSLSRYTLESCLRTSCVLLPPNSSSRFSWMPKQLSSCSMGDHWALWDGLASLLYR